MNERQADVRSVNHMLGSSKTAQSGANDAALGELFRAHYLRLVRLGIQLVDDQTSAEDLVQDVFARIHRTGRSPTELADPARYLTVAVVNQSRSVLRWRRVARLNEVDHASSDEPPSRDSPDEQVIREARSAAISAAVRRLPTRQQQVVVLRYYEGWSIAEIAIALKLSHGAVSSSLERAPVACDHDWSPRCRRLTT